MTIKIGGKEFNGPYGQTSSLKDESGTYVVSTKNKSGNHKVLDVGESKKVKERVEGHDRAQCWKDNKEDGLFYSAYYCDKDARKTLADDIRDSLNPPCGEK